MSATLTFSPELTLLDAPATGAFLGVAVPTLADWRTKGIGPTYIKVGRCVRYRQSDLDSWLSRRTQRMVE